MAKLPASDPAQQVMRQTIDRQSAQLARILDDMIDIARVTRGELHMERAPVEIAKSCAGRARAPRPSSGPASSGSISTCRASRCSCGAMSTG
jgi:signal transduction histidine kinase